MIIDIEKNYVGRFTLEQVAQDFQEGLTSLVEKVSAVVNPSGIDSLFTKSALEYLAAVNSLCKRQKMLSFDLFADAQFAGFGVIGSFVLPFDVQRSVFYSREIDNFSLARIFFDARVQIAAQGGSTGFELSEGTYFWFNLPTVKRSKVIGSNAIECRGIKNGGSYALSKGDPVIIADFESGERQISCRHFRDGLCHASDTNEYDLQRRCVYLAAEVSGD